MLSKEKNAKESSLQGSFLFMSSIYVLLLKQMVWSTILSEIMWYLSFVNSTFAEVGKMGLPDVTNIAVRITNRKL